MSSSDEDVADYRAGLIAVASVTAICFFFAMICLPIFMCLGRDRVGFLSGAPLTSQTNKGSTVDGKSEKNCVTGASPTVVRSVFIGSGMMFILFAILIVTQGVTNLQDTIVAVHRSAVDIDSIATEADDIMNSGLLSVQDTATSVRDGILTELTSDNFCPADPTLANNEAAAKIRAQADEAVQLLTLLDNFLGDRLPAASTAVQQAAKGAQQVESATDDVDLTDWEALVILIPYTIVPCLLVAAAIMAQYDVQFPFLNCAINWFLMPFFVIMVIVCAGVACGMVAAASANSDFCLPGGRPELDVYSGLSPDTTIYRFLDRKQFTEAALVRQVADYYVAQCRNATDPFDFLRSYLPTLVSFFAQLVKLNLIAAIIFSFTQWLPSFLKTESQASLKDFSGTIQSDDVQVSLALYCNREYDSVDTLLDEMNELISILLVALQRTLDLISCERIVPIYHRAIYDGTCNYSVSAMFWIFSAALLMGFFGIIMILCRASYKPTEYDTTEAPMAKLYDDNEPELVVYDDGNVQPQYSPRKQSSTPYTFTPPRSSFSPNNTNVQTTSNYSPNKSSIYIEDSPGRNASYY